MSAARNYPAAALLLVLVATAAQLGYHYVPPAAAADVWNIGLACLVLVLLLLVANAYRAAAMWRVCGLVSTWAVLQAGCSLAWLVRPWKVEPGQAQCSAVLDFPLTIISAWLAGLAAAGVWARRHG